MRICEGVSSTRASSLVAVSILLTMTTSPESAWGQAPTAAPRQKEEQQTGQPDDATDTKRPSEEQNPEKLSPEEIKALEDALGGDASSNAPQPVAAAAAPPPSGNAMNPQIALILDAALAWFSSDDEVVAELQGGGHDPRVSGFTLQQLEMHLEASVDTYFKLAANIVFTQFGVEVEEAYATTLGLPAGLQVRAGQLLTRFGQFNATHPHSWSFADQPLALTRMFGGESNRGLGAEVSWLTPAPWVLEVVASATMPLGDCCARSYFGGSGLSLTSPGELLYTVAVKQFFDLSDDWGLSWGLSAQFGPNATGNGNRTELYGTDLHLRYRPVANTDRMALSLRFEGILRARSVPGDSLLDYATYLHLVWTIDPDWELGVRHEAVMALEDDPLDPGQDGLRQRISVQATFRPSHFSRIRLQGNYDVAAWRAEPTFGGILAIEFLIGAHGAHTY